MLKEHTIVEAEVDLEIGASRRGTACRSPPVRRHYPDARRSGPFLLPYEEKTPMIRKRSMMLLTLGFAVLIVLSAMVLAAEMQGTVSAVDDKGMATIKTMEGKELKVSLTGVKAGDKVDCHTKDGKTSCHKLSSTHK
jgi:hypothetical protein